MSFSRGSERSGLPRWFYLLARNAAIDQMRTFAGGEYGMPCLLMLRRLPAGSRHDKTELNAILRDHGVNG